MSTRILLPLSIIWLLFLSLAPAEALAQKGGKAKKAQLKGAYAYSTASLYQPNGQPATLDAEKQAFIDGFVLQTKDQNIRFTFKGKKLIYNSKSKNEKGTFAIKGKKLTIKYGTVNETMDFKLDGNTLTLYMADEVLKQEGYVLRLVFVKQ